MADENHPAVPGAVAVRDGTKARGQKLDVQYAFADRSVVATPTPGTIWISVGTNVGSGLVNFRSPGSPDRGACESVLRLQGEIFSHVMAEHAMHRQADSPGPSLRIKIVLPEDWKPDDAAAAWLVHRLLEDGQLPPLARQLAAHMSRSRRSPSEVLRPRRYPIQSMSEAADDVALIEANTFLADLESASEPPPPIPLFTAMLCHFQCAKIHGAGGLGPRGPRDDPRKDALLERMIGIVDHAHDCLNGAASASIRPDGSRPSGVLTWRDFDMRLTPEWSSNGQYRLADDVRQALQRLDERVRERGTLTLTEICIPARDNLTGCKAQLLAVRSGSNDNQPASPYFEAMAFSGELVQAQHYPGRKGHLPLVVMSSQQRNSRWRHDVFLTRVSGRATDRDDARHDGTLEPSLRGLGLELEQREQDAYRQPSSLRGDVDAADPRRGSSSRYEDIPGIEDPWYDGRDHDYLIAGSPHVGSKLPPEDVEAVLREKFWLPRIAHKSGEDRNGYDLLARFTLTVDEGPAPPVGKGDDSDTTKRVFRCRSVQSESGSHIINYVHSDARRQDRGRRQDRASSAQQAPNPRITVTGPEQTTSQTGVMDGTCTSVRADPDLLACPTTHEGTDRDAKRSPMEGKRISGEFWIVLARPDPPPLRAARSVQPTIREAVPEHVRLEMASRVCHPLRETIEFGRECLADIGPDGVVIWDLDGKFLQSKHDPSVSVLPRAVLVCADVLAHERELKDLAEILEQIPDPRNTEFTSRTLGRFVAIASEYRPDRVNVGLRQLCEVLDRARAVPALLDRLERVLKFTDERARLLEERAQKRRERTLNVALLLIALLALVGIPAELIQAANSWSTTSQLHGSNLIEFLSSDPSAEWMLGSAVRLFVAAACLYALLWLLWWGFRALKRR